MSLERGIDATRIKPVKGELPPMTALKSLPTRSRSLGARLCTMLMPLMLASLVSAGCDIVTADLRSEETAQWHKTYQLDPGGRVEVGNVNGKIDVEPSAGNTVDITALKKARGATPEAAKAALDRATIAEDVSSGAVKIDTKIARGEGGMFSGNNVSVEYHVKVPLGAEVKFTTVNGGIDISGLEGRITAETTNGGVSARSVKGQIDASTTNGGLDIDLARVAEGGVKLDCTNGGIKLRLPRDAKATISASITNGGISAGDLAIDSTGENSRRRLEGRMNGGGPRIQIEGTNGGITLTGR
jgi:Putative adhesin